MKFNLKHTTTVNNFLITDNQLFVVQTIDKTNNTKLLKLQDLSVEWTLQTCNGSGFYSNHNTLMVLDGQGNVDILSIKRNKQHYYENIAMANLLQDGIIYFDRNSNKTVREKFDAGVVWKTSERLGHINLSNDFLLFSNKFLQKKDFYCFALNNGEELWHFPLTTLKDMYTPFPDWEVWYFVGVVEGVLWVDLRRNGSAKGALLGLEAQTGAVKHFLYQASPQTEGGFDYIPTTANTQYDPKTHKLIAFGNYHYWELDLNQTPYEVRIWNLEEKLRALNTYFAVNRVNAINDDYIFSFSGYLGNTTSQVFAFNRHTFEIDWRYVFDMEERGYYTPTKVEVTETHLFVLDSKGTLHIFEREA